MHMAKIYPKAGLPPLITVDDLDMPGINQTAAMNAIKLASGAVRDYCHWRIDRETVLNYQQSGDGSRLLLLPTAYLVSVDKVVVDQTELKPFSFTEEWHYSVMTFSAGIRLRGRQCWPQEEERISIDFVHGYQLCDPDDSPGTDDCGIPDGLKSIIKRIARRGLDNPESVESLRVGEIDKSFGAGSAGMQAVYNRFGVRQIDEYVLNGYRVDVQ